MERTDSKVIYGASVLTEQAAQGLVVSRGRNDWITLLQALAALSANQAKEGDPAPLFSAEMLRTKSAELDVDGQQVYWLADEDTGRKKFSKAWENLEKAFPLLRGNLCQRSEKARLPGYLEIVSEPDPIDKRVRLYGFRVVPMELPKKDEQQKINAEIGTKTPESPEDPDSIEYFEEMEVYPLPWIKRPLRINVQGWRSLFMTLPLIGALVLVVLGSWLWLQLLVSKLPVRDIFQWTVLIGVLGGIIGWIVWPLYRLIDQKIVIAPAILQMTSTFYHVLVIRREDEKKVVRMLRFTATCPVCGGLVEIQEGARRLRGRYIGACDRNPIEHLFSFDHVLRSGRRIELD